MPRLTSAFFMVMVEMSFITNYIIHLRKKLVRSRDMIFFENQTIKDIKKLENMVPQGSDKLDSVTLTTITSSLSSVNDDIKHAKHDDAHTDKSNSPIGDIDVFHMHVGLSRYR